MGRKVDPDTRYKVYCQKDGKYHYASVQVPKPAAEIRRSRYRIVHLGKVDGNLVFTPNPYFRLLDVKERIKYRFPPDWDISAAEAMNAEDLERSAILEKEMASCKESEKADLSADASLKTEAEERRCPEAERASGEAACMEQYSDRLYGSFWLLSEIAEKEGLFDDLLEVFGGSHAKTMEVLSLAFFSLLSGKSEERFARWQNTHETDLEDCLKADDILKLVRSITEENLMELIRKRIRRLSEEDLPDHGRSGPAESPARGRILGTSL